MDLTEQDRTSLGGNINKNDYLYLRNFTIETIFQSQHPIQIVIPTQSDDPSSERLHFQCYPLSRGCQMIQLNFAVPYLLSSCLFRAFANARELRSLLMLGFPCYVS